MRENTKEGMVSREVETRKIMLERKSEASKGPLSREVIGVGQHPNDEW